MMEILESHYVTNLLLLAIVLLLFRIAQAAQEIYAMKRDSEASLRILHQNMPDRSELMRVIGFIAEEQAKSRDKLHEIANLEEAIIRKIPGPDR